VTAVVAALFRLMLAPERPADNADYHLGERLGDGLGASLQAVFRNDRF